MHFLLQLWRKHFLFKHTGMVSHERIVFDTKLNLIAEPPMNSVARKQTWIPMLSAGFTQCHLAAALETSTTTIFIAGNYWGSGPVPAVLQDKCWYARIDQQHKKGLYSTKYSQTVTHPSTNSARCCLTLVIERELVCSAWCGLRHLLRVESWVMLQMWGEGLNRWTAIFSQ